VALEEGKFQVGSLTLHPIHTPGHTDGHFAYSCEDRVFTGDALLIEGCGRSDFQNGDAEALFASVTGKLFSLPDDDRQSARMSGAKEENRAALPLMSNM
jgi:sulfur dioxygenase